jgi:uncharacterized protein involved in exopolysaccharide biosynthesis
MSTPIGTEDTDLKAFLRRYLRTWPLLIPVAIVLLGIVVLLVVFVPPSYSASSSILIETPMRYDDPNRMVQTPDRTIPTTDKNYYTNEKLRITSQPILMAVVKQLGLTTQYYEEGLIDRPVYPAKPIIVEVDSSRLPKHDAMPNGIMFYVTGIDGKDFHLEGDGEYGPTSREIDVDRTEQWGHWFMLDSLRLRVDRSPQLARDSTSVTYGFCFQDPRDVTLGLMDAITADFVETDASTVLLTLTSATSVQAMDILNAVGNEYVATHLAERREMLDRTIAQVDSEISRNLSSLGANSDAVESFRTVTGVTDVDHEKVMLMERSEGLDKQRENLMVKAQYYAYLKKLLSEKNTSDQLISPKVFGIQDPILNDMTEQLISLQSDITALKNEGKTAHPYYVQLTQRLEQQRANLLTSVTGFEETNNMLLANINQQYRKLAGQQTAIPGTERELDDKQRDARTLEAQHSDLLARAANLRIARSAIEPEVRMITPAYLTSTDPFFPNIVILALVAAALWLLFPLGFLVIKSLFSDRILAMKDLARALPDCPLVGQVPYTSLTNPEALIAQPRSEAYIEVSKVAFGLELRKRSEGPLVTVLSNANDKGTGRTLAEMLASVLALRGNRTLLVDATSTPAGPSSPSRTAIETVRPGLDRATVFDLPSDPGLELTKQGEYGHVLIVGPSAAALPAWPGIRSIHYALILCQVGETRYATLEELALAQMNGQLPEMGIVVNKVMEKRLPYLGFLRSKKEKGLGFWGALKYNWQRAF